MSRVIFEKLHRKLKINVVYESIDYSNDVEKCSKFKWNHEPQLSGFTAKLWTFYGVISLVYKSVECGKLWSIFFYNNIYFWFPAKFLGKSRVTCYVISIFGEWFTSFSRVLSTSRVGYHAGNPIESEVYCYYEITLSKTENVSVLYEFTGTINHRFSTNQNARTILLIL